MTEIKTLKGTWTAKSSIAHGSDENFGMEQRFRTQKVAVWEDDDFYMEDVPFVSGNSLKGILRDLLAKDLLDRFDIEVSDKLLYALYAGGSLEKGSGGGKIQRKFIENIRENLPMLSLLGTAASSEMIESKMNMGMLVPVAKETNGFTGRDAEHSIFQFLDETFYTRIDDIEGGTDRDDGEQTQQMKYNVQVLVPGTKFHHRMTLQHCNEVEEAALYHAFELFKQNPHIGGMQSKGHGRVEFEYDGDGLGDNTPYLEFIEESKEQIRDFLETLDEKLNG